MRAAAILTVAMLAAGAALAHESGAGEPAGADAAGQVVDVTMTDADGKMAFTPDRLEVKAGAAVKFVIHNAGVTTHEFVLGDRAESLAHQRMMEAMPDMRHDDPNAKTLDPGKTATLNWRFTRKGEFEYDCLLPGHYEAGMHGVVIVK